MSKDKTESNESNYNVDHSDQDKNDVWISEDGQVWDLIQENAEFHPRSYHDSFEFKNKI